MNYRPSFPEYTFQIQLMALFLFLLLNVQYTQIRINHQFNHLYTDPVIAQLVERETVVE